MFKQIGGYMKFTINLEIEIEFTGKYYPAKEGVNSLNVLPENCYMSEDSEFDVEDIKIIIPLGKGQYKRIDCPNDIADLISFEELQQKADDKYYSDL
jgi:hypothetical protein